MDVGDLLDAKIYVGTYKKYNEGSLFGRWLTLSDYSDKEEFYDACKELHSDEEDAEFMFQDWEGIPEGLISESWISEAVFELIGQADIIKDMDAFLAFVPFAGFSFEEEEVGYLFSKFSDCYHGRYDSEEDYVTVLVDECYNLPEIVRTYFDYEKYRKDLFSTLCYYDERTKAVFSHNY